MRHLLERQHHLEQRVPCLRARRVEHVDEPLERHVGIGERVQVGFACAGEEFGERLGGVDVGTQHQGVDEHADQVVQRLLTTAGDRGAHSDVGGARQTREQHRQGGVHHHEQGDAVGAGHGGELFVGVGVDLESDARAAEALLLWARAVAGQVELVGQAVESALPVVELTRGHRGRVGLGAEQIVLPLGVVAVLDRQRQPGRGLARGTGQVGGGDVAGQRAERETVGRDVVDDEGHRVFRCARAVTGGLGGGSGA